MIETYTLLAPGVPASGELTVDAPFDGQPIATVETSDWSAVDTPLATAHGLFRDRDSWLPKAQRIEILDRARELMIARREDLAIEAAREGAKPLADSLAEVDRAIDGLRECSEYARTAAGREIPMGLNAASSGRPAFTTHEPIGVVLAFSAFNHPVNLIVHQVGPAVDLADAIPLLSKGGFYHAGQVCVSVQRVFAHRSIAEDLAERLAESAARLAVGDPTSADTDVGPLIRPSEVTRVGSWVAEARADGGRVIAGGEPLSTRTFAPTVLFDPPADAKGSAREIFGPVVTVTPWDDVDGAVACP